MEMDRVDNKMNFSRFIKLLKLGKPPAWLIVFAMLLSLLESGAGLIVPLFTRDLIDQIASLGIDWRLILFLAGAFLFQTISGGFSFYLMTYVGERMVAGIRRNIWEHVLHLPIPFFDKRETGEIMSRITQDTNIIKMLVTNHLISFLSGIVSIIGSLILLIVIDWKMTLMMLLSVPIALIVITPLGKVMYRISVKTQDEMALFSGQLGRVLNDIRLVKSSNAEENEKKEGREKIERLFGLGLKEAKIMAFISPIMTMIMMGVVVLVIGYGGARVASGDLTPGSLVAIIIYLVQIILPFSQLASFFTSLQKAFGATERIQLILEDEIETIGSVKDCNFANPITFNNISFAYETGKPVLKNIHFEIKPGERVAIVGPSGGGKTTLFSLIERFYIPESGTIQLGGQNIRDIDLRVWRDSIGYVSQESPIMAGTVKENICYGLKREVVEEEIQEAAKLANAEEFIEQLPNGLDTEVGERGVKLSGGQRQRIAIARALLRNPKLLLLDEATSNLDSESETLVQEGLRNLMKGRTTLVIAHRLSTVVDADRIVVLEKGEITGIGSHEELLETNELYRKLVRQQFHIIESASE